MKASLETKGKCVSQKLPDSSWLSCASERERQPLSITDLETELGGASLHHCKPLPCFSQVLQSHLHDTMSLTPFHQEKSHRLWSSLAPWSYLDASPVRAKHLLLYVSYVASVLGQWLPQPSSQKLYSSGTPPPDWYIRSVAIMGSTSTLPQEAGCFRKKTILSPFDCSFDVFRGMGATLCHAYPRFACLPAVYLPSLQNNY